MTPPDPMIMNLESRGTTPEVHDHGKVSTFTLPDLGEGLTEAEIITWRVAAGDAIGVDDIVVEVETAKAAVEVPCPFAGRVVELHAAPGTVVAVGRPLVSIAATPAATLQPADARSRAAEAHRAEERAGSGAVLVGYGTSDAATRRRRPRATSAASPTAATSGPRPQPPEAPDHPAPGSAAAGSGTHGGQGSTDQAPRVVSPVVRRLAREHGIKVASLTGTGPAGVVLRRDVDAAATLMAAGTPSDASLAAAAPGPAAAAQPETRRTVLRGVRRTVADRLTRSRREIPDATTWVDVDATALVAARDALQTMHPDRPIGLLALLSRFVVAGLVRYPDLNSSVETDGGDLVVVRHGLISVGFAAQTDRGLVVPVVRDAGRMTTAELAASITDLTERARAGTLRPEHLTGGTFTLNNYGVFGVDGSTPIVNHPEAALLGIGRIVEKPWVVDGELAVRQVTQLSLTFDHRVCDGGVAGGFLRFVADCVEQPLGLLADV